MSFSRRLLPWLLPLLISLSSLARAQELETLTTGAKADLQRALDDLAEARRKIEADRLPLARELTRLEQQLIEQKSALQKAERFQENQLVELNALKNDARLRGEEVKYLESLLTEYTRAFRSRLSFVEEPRYRALFDRVEKAVASPDLPPVERFTQRTAILETSLQRAGGALGGELIEGQALDSLGKVQGGKVALVGPVAVFAGTSGDAAGLLQQELNKAEPTVMEVTPAVAAASRALATTGSGQLNLDPTLGNAFKLAALDEGIVEKLAEGGLVMIPLLGLGVAALLVALVKWLQLSRVRLVSETDLQKVLRHLEKGESQPALSHARGISGLAGELLATAVEHADEKKEYIEEVVYEKMLGARTRLERGIPFLALVATTGPLMGLLGTVMGMIATFKLISSFGSGDPKLLAAGISEALIATATGMAVAIPALLLHAFLSRKAKSVIGSMEQTAVGFINGVPDQNTFA